MPGRNALAVGLVVLLATWTGHLRADPVVLSDPDTAAARRHFDAGLELYGLDRYAEAIREFELARSMRAIPAFDYNIGLCQERMERWADAIAAYERFLAAMPPFSEESAHVRSRIGALRLRVGNRPKRAAPRLVMRSFGIAALSVAAASLIAGTATYLSVYPSYQSLRDQCGPTCAASQTIPVWDRVQRAEGAAIGLWSVAGIAAAVGIPLLVYSRDHADRATSIQLSGQGIRVAGSF